MKTIVNLTTGEIVTRGLTAEEIAALPVPQAAPVPQIVTRFQALAALYLAGYLPEVEAIMASSETSVLTKLAWGNALSFERSSPTLATLAQTLEIDSESLDELFTIASGISA